MICSPVGLRPENIFKGETMNEPKPVKRVEVTEKNRRLRIIAAIILAVIGAIGITTGIMTALNRETGWQTVQVASKERNCSESFTLRYNFEGSGAQVASVNRQLEAAYEEACIKAYQLFTADEEIAGVHNVHYINRHPNEEITVDPVLYRALEKLADTPYLYLGPVYAYYYNLTMGVEDAMVEALDPLTDAESRRYVGSLAGFAGDGFSIRLELLGDNRVKLHVSQTYQQFAEVEEIENFIDFAYMANAFIIDYLADTLTEAGLTNGYLVSVDGYTRNLCSQGAFRFTVFDKVQERVYPAGEMEYTGPISMVYLKSYPTEETMHLYRKNGDHFISLYADPAGGVYNATKSDLIGYSYDASCADVLLRLLPDFVGQWFSKPMDVYSVWCDEDTIIYNDPALSVGNLLQNEEVSYQAELIS